MRRSIAWLGVAAAAMVPVAAGAAGDPLPLDQLLQQFRAEAPPEPEGKVNLAAWVERTVAGRAVVIVLEPEGETKLNADPGILVTPEDDQAIRWQVPVPYHRIDQAIAYFEPPMTVRLPFSGDSDRPIRLLVEYAYCIVDYQCFFGEETLTVTAR